MPQVGAAIVSFFTSAALAAGASAGWATWIGAAAARLLTSLALTVVEVLIAKASQKKNIGGGIRTSATQTGGINPVAFVIGKSATSGSMVCPPMSHGKSGKTQNAYLTYVISMSDIRGMALSRLMIDGEYVTIGGASATVYGNDLGGKWANKAWIKYYDGSQTTADATLISKYSAYPSRPWQSDMIGRDTCYAIVTFLYTATLNKNFPAVRFETTGIPLYDPRFDTTVGGSGSQRWATPSTWVASSNPAVQCYNILRGISLADGSVWGGGVAAADLPLAAWFAAMNACDVATALGAGGTEAAYRSGIEIKVNDQPADILDELTKACSGQLFEIGGVWKMVVGAAAMPVIVITDDDIIRSASEQFDSFPSLAQTFNGVSATYPEPTSLYESISAPVRLSSTYETEDGGRRLVADLQLPAVPFTEQVQRLMVAYQLDARRFRRHAFTLGPSAMILEPTDTISWTSAANGYTTKLFEAASVNDDLNTGLQALAVRERDPNDYTWSTGSLLPSSPAPGVFIPSTQTPLRLFDNPFNMYPDFDMVLDDFYATSNGAIATLIPTATQAIGQQYLQIAVNAALRSITTEWFLVEPGTDYVIGASAWLATGAVGAGTAKVEFETASLDAAGATTSLTVVTIATATDTAYTAGVSDQSTQVTTDTNARRARFVLTRSAGGTQVAAFGGLEVLKKSTRTLISDDAILSRHIADDEVHSKHLVIDELLAINALTAGFSMGKSSASDFDTDGLYMGRTLKSGGGTGFGFLMGQTTLSGVRRYIQHTTDDGFSIVNANFGLLANIVSPPVQYTTSQTVTLNPLISTLNLTVLGGGGGGAGYTANGSNGGDTIVQLYDGVTYAGVTWTSTGGAGGLFTSSVVGNGGSATPYGVGGLQRGNSGSPWTQATAATGYGSGGGGGGPSNPPHQSGAKSNILTVAYNVGALGLTAPKLVITIGAKGTCPDVASSNYPGKDGSPGMVIVDQIISSVVPAGVIPLYPTATGTFTKAANATGNTVFPNLGAGMWVIAENTGAVMGLNSLQITDSLGASLALTLTNALTATFVSNTRPNILTGNGTARTIKYAFYKMQVT